jgi:MFS family permease
VNYRRFFFGQAVSLSGTWMQSVAIAWVILQLTHSATWLGIAIALQTLPVLVLGPYAGVLVDRVDKRRLLVGTQIAGAVQALAVSGSTVYAGGTFSTIGGLTARNNLAAINPDENTILPDVASVGDTALVVWQSGPRVVARGRLGAGEVCDPQADAGGESDAEYRTDGKGE